MENPIVAFMTRSRVGPPDELQSEMLRFDAVVPRGNHLELLHERNSARAVWVGVLQAGAELGLWMEMDNAPLALFAPAFECVGPPVSDSRRAKAFRRAFSEALDIRMAATIEPRDRRSARRWL